MCTFRNKSSSWKSYTLENYSQIFNQCKISTVSYVINLHVSKHINVNLINSFHSFIIIRQFLVIEFIKQACVNCWKFFHSQVNFVKPFSVPIQQQPSNSPGDGSCIFSLSQVIEIHPLTS